MAFNPKTNHTTNNQSVLCTTNIFSIFGASKMLMPYYLVTIITHNKKKFEGIKENPSDDMDFMYRHFYHLAINSLGKENIIGYDCVMVSTLSNVYKAHQKKNQRDRPRRYG